MISGGCLRNITFIEKQAKQFPKRKNGLPSQMVSPTLVCLYAFFSLVSSYRFRLRKSWKNPKIDRVMKKTVKTKNTAHRACASSADWFWSARMDKRVLLTNFHVNIFSVRSKLSELQPQTWNMCFIWVIVFDIYFGSPYPYQFLFWSRKYNNPALE